MKTADKYGTYPESAKTKDMVFNLLAKEKGKYISGQEIGRILGISRPAVWKHIKALSTWGIPIESVKTKGYKLSGDADMICPGLIHSNLNTKFMGQKILYTLETGSTNNDAKRLADDYSHYPEGTVLIAGRQSKGKGRLGRKWVSLPGSVMLSVILRPKIPPMQVPALSLVTGYSIAKTIQDVCGVEAKVKWPNDILVHNKKLCGILCEIRAEMDRTAYVIIGMGINVNVNEAKIPAAIKHITGSIYEETGILVDRNSFIAWLLNEYENSYLRFVQSGFPQFIPEIQNRLAYLGTEVTVSNMTDKDKKTITGILTGIDGDGKIKIKQPGGPELSLAAGDVSLRLSEQS